MNRSGVVVLASVVLLIGGGLFVTSGQQDQGEGRKGEGGAREWIVPASKQLEATGCRYPDDTTLEARVGRLAEEIEGWEERARLAPSEYLRSALRLEEILKCSGVDAEGRALAEDGQRRLIEQLEARLRAAHALFRRGLRRGDRVLTSRAIGLIDELLEELGGPTRSRLKRLRQHYD